MLKQILLAVATALLLLSGTLLGDEVGTISGVVVDDAGAPVSGAVVTYYNLPPVTVRGRGLNSIGLVGVGGVRAIVTTAQDGTFTIGSLPIDTYYLCAMGTQPTHLATCEWTAAPTKVDLSVSPVVQGIQFQIVNGSLLKFTVHDPRGLIKDLADFPVVNGLLPIWRPDANFSMGVFVGARYAVPLLVSNTGAVRRYQIALPKTALASLFLETALTITTGNGVPLTPHGTSMSISVSGQAAIPIDLYVP